MNASRLGALALTLLVAACSQSARSTASSSAAPSPQASAPAASNPLDFPLADGVTVITTRDFHAVAGGHTVAGTEVIAQSSKSLDDLEAWLKDTSAKPPQGYAVSASGSGVDEAHARAAAYGMQFEVFSHTESGKTHELVVVVLDPATFDAKAGPVLSLVDKYSMLPQSLRDPVDAQVKARTGLTVTQMLDPSQPVGAALAAAKTLRASGQRGVVLVDAAKD
jgi:hypothetical protein